METEPTLRATVLVCTLRPSPIESSTELLAGQVLADLTEFGASGETVRVVDYEVHPGVELDMGDGDEWSIIREKVIASDIVVVATPIWLGQPSSICQRVLERLDAELSEHDDEGRLLTYGKVAAVAVVGNEDGAHHVSAVVFQALNDVGFSLAPGAVTYWVGEAMSGTDYKDLDTTPDAVRSTTRTLASNAVHLAHLLSDRSYPPS